MARKAYSYVFKREVLLLNDDEFQPVDDALRKMREHQKIFRKENGRVLLKHEIAKSEQGQKVIELCRDLTGVELSHPMSASNLKLSKYGGLCPRCKKPFRTPRAKLCVECGYELENGKIAGLLSDA